MYFSITPTFTDCVKTNNIITVAYPVSYPVSYPVPYPVSYPLTGFTTARQGFGVVFTLIFRERCIHLNPGCQG